MKKEKNRIVRIDESFGFSKCYHILTVRSSLNLFSFTAFLSRFCHSDFCYIGEFEAAETPEGAAFKMMYSKVSEKEDINLIVLENKTTIDPHSVVLKSNKEKNLQFQTLSLFEEQFYLFNAQGYSLFKGEEIDYDYLLLFYVDKENKITDFINRLLDTDRIRCKDISTILSGNGKKDKDRIHFLQNLFYTAALKADIHRERQTEKLLGSRNRIPAQNFTYRFDPGLTVVIREEHLRLITQDETFE